jgi:predicted esterase YcpF (UPF0227 family)
MNIIYIHGFNSSGESEKINQLRKYFKSIGPKVNIISPTLSANPRSAISELSSIIKTTKGPVIVIGTSLGGFYALYCSARFDVPAFVINPSLEPHISLAKNVGMHTRYGNGEPYEFKKEYLDSLKFLFDTIQSSSMTSSNLHFYISSDDELLSFDKLDQYFPYRKTLKKFENAGHSFSRFSEILPDVEAVANELKSISESIQNHQDLLYI